MKTIDEDKIEELCGTYTAVNAEQWRVREALDCAQENLDDALKPLQTLFRRKLGLVCHPNKAVVLRARVFASVDHSKRPVTVTPVASGLVLVKKGVELSLNFVATRENIEEHCERLGRVIKAYA